MAGGNNHSKDENRPIYTCFICRKRIPENFNIFGIMTSQTQNFPKKIDLTPFGVSKSLIRILEM